MKPGHDPKAAPRRCAVAQLSFIGDMVFTTPLLDALKRAWPGTRVVVVGRPHVLEVLEDHPSVDETLAYDKHGSSSGWGGLRRLARALREDRPEVFIGVTRSARTAALARLVGSPTRVGFSGPWRAIAYTALAGGRDDSLSFPCRPLALARTLGLSAEPSPPRLVVRDERRAQARERLLAAGWAGKPILAIAPGANYETKRWSEERVRELLERVLAEGRLQPALYGGPGERALVARLCRGRAGVLDRSSTGVGEMCAELALSAGFVGNDSGPTHIARALGVPCVSVIGPTPAWPIFVGEPQGVVSRGLDCQPCSPHGDPRCPLGHHRCMTEISSDAVLEALRAQGVTT